jgi:hypothetical protein
MVEVPAIVLKRSISDIDDIPRRSLNYNPLLGQGGRREKHSCENRRRDQSAE